MRLATSLSALALAWTSLVAASNVIDLDPDNFNKYVGGSKPALVEFFAPWCGHCKTLAPTYEKLADAFPSQKVVVAKTDADGVGRSLGEKFGVTGFPTLKWFPANSQEPVDYTGGRDLDALVAFITEKTGAKSSIKPPPPPAAVQLDAGNFDRIALNSSKNVLVAFTAPWCGHCKNMKAAYEKVALAFKNEPDCVVAGMNADDEQNRPVAGKYGVSSYPTIQFFPKGSNEPIMYTQPRTEEGFTEFLNEHCGTHRTPSGLLNDLAGKVVSLDTLASDFFTAGLPDRQSILTKAKDALAALQSTGAGAEKRAEATASYYVRAMERVVEKGEGWLVKEQTRIAGLLASPSLAPTKLDELKIKANILSSFAIKKVEQLAEDASNYASDTAQQVQEAAEGMYEGAKEKVQEATGRVKAEL